MSQNRLPPYPLRIEYLPDTYFLHSKRPLIYRPYTQEIDSPTPRSKRQRTGPSPVEHRTLSLIKKQEREMNKRNQSCTTHHTMTNTPGHILKFIQDQATTLKRTNETLEELHMQVASLTKKTVTPQASPLPKPNLTLLHSYHTIITQTLETLKKLPNQFPNNTIRVASECIPRIRYLIMLQCNFDVCQGGNPPSTVFPAINQSNLQMLPSNFGASSGGHVNSTVFPVNNQSNPQIFQNNFNVAGGGGLHSTALPAINQSNLQTTLPVAGPSFEVNRSTPYWQWHYVCTTLQRMEINMRMYMNILNTESQTGTWAHVVPMQPHPSQITQYHSSQLQTMQIKKPRQRLDKRKAIDDFPIPDQPSPILAGASNISSIKPAVEIRKKLATKRFSFSYLKDTMDID